MADPAYAADWRSVVTYGFPGPQPHLILDEPELRVLVAGLEPGGRIPPHPGPRAVYHALEGHATLLLDGTPLPFAAGAIVVAPAGATRGFEAQTRFAFLGVRLGPE